MLAIPPTEQTHRQRAPLTSLLACTSGEGQEQRDADAVERSEEVKQQAPDQEDRVLRGAETNEEERELESAEEENIYSSLFGWRQREAAQESRCEEVNSSRYN